MPAAFAELKAESHTRREAWLYHDYFFTKIFRMTSFASREAMTTAELPEPLNFQHAKFIITK